MYNSDCSTAIHFSATVNFQIVIKTAKPAKIIEQDGAKNLNHEPPQLPVNLSVKE